MLQSHLCAVLFCTRGFSERRMPVNLCALVFGQELERFVSASGPEGTVVVSMGSSVKSAGMPASLRRVFVAAFAKLRQRVVWKWEHGYNSTFPETLPPNVHLVRWLPQQDLLGE
jgi:glucuronosyltransferase